MYTRFIPVLYNHIYTSKHPQYALYTVYAFEQPIKQVTLVDSAHWVDVNGIAANVGEAFKVGREETGKGRDGEGKGREGKGGEEKGGEEK